jgi:hypothetical protein
MNQDCKRPYLFLIVLALLASSYSYFKTGISSPVHPPLLTSKLLALDSIEPPISYSSKPLGKDTSDRMLSPIHQYIFRDGSKLLAVMVRIRKRDDFKIETYGLLTKGIDPIYIESPSFNNTVPFSMLGVIDGKKALQTCVIPGTTKLDQVNVQLFPLLSQADRLAGSSQSLASKLLGTDDRSDYSCLVLTYHPKSVQQATETWTSIIENVQIALSNRKNL